MHMRLEVLDAARLLHHVEALGDPRRVRADVDVAVAASDSAEGGEDLAVLRLLSFRIKVDAELDEVSDLLAHGGVVDVPEDLRSGQHQLAAVRKRKLTLLSDGPFHEQSRADVAGVRPGC